jgi:hypothetical protein
MILFYKGEREREREREREFEFTLKNRHPVNFSTRSFAFGATSAKAFETAASRGEPSPHIRLG